MGLPGVSFEPEQRRVYPLGSTAAHVIGFSDSGGEGLAGAEGALNEDIRSAAAGHGAVPLSIDLRIQAALEDELYKAAAQFRPRGAVGVVTNVHTGEILGMANWPTSTPTSRASRRRRAPEPRRRVDLRDGLDLQGLHRGGGLDTGVATPQTTFDATPALPARLPDDQRLSTPPTAS
jgi:cell division protein FtsI (penicillin-binding protein 3)